MRRHTGPAGLCHRAPQLLAELLDSGDLLADSWPGVLSQRVAEQLDACGNERALHHALRQSVLHLLQLALDCFVYSVYSGYFRYLLWCGRGWKCC